MVSPCGEDEGEWEGEEEGVRVLGTMDVDHCGRRVDEEERPDQNERATEQNLHPEIAEMFLLIELDSLSNR